MRFLFLASLFFCTQLFAQSGNKNSADFQLYKEYRYKYQYFEEINRDSAILYANLAAEIAFRNKKILAANFAMVNTAYQLNSMGKYSAAFQMLLDVFEVANDARYDNIPDWPFPDSIGFSKPRYVLKSFAHIIFGQLMWQTDNNPKSIEAFKESETWGRAANANRRVMIATMNLARSYYTNNTFDSVLIYSDSAIAAATRANYFKYTSQVYNTLGLMMQRRGQLKEAEELFRKGIDTAKKYQNLASENINAWALCRLLIEENRTDEALPLAMENLATFNRLGALSTRWLNIGSMYENIYLCYEINGNKDSTLKYETLTLKAKDSINTARLRSISEFQNQSLDEQLRLKNIEKEKILYQNRIRNLALFGGLTFISAIAFILYRNNRQKQKANQLLEQTLTELKDTQSQLIHAEKMASLGELTAGIAHEIQNPLNFVNNFSDLNLELLDELKTAQDPATKEQLISDLEKNIEKVLHHGKRADTIVKGMLSHSRKNSGKRTPTNINALCDEYIKIAYHSLGARGDNSKISIQQHYEHHLPKLNMVPQDIGRVILNLINNAYYAVLERSAEPSFEPKVTVSSFQRDNKVHLVVEDNGKGIPESIKEKIFQPFFTTKPTGEGTGLGLSLSYDVIKAHKGSIAVESEEGKGTKFTVILPLD